VDHRTFVVSSDVAEFSGSDMTRALALVEVAASGDVGAPFDGCVLGFLARLVPGDVVGYAEREIVTRRLLVGAEASDWRDSREVTLAASTYCHQHPLSIQRHSRETRALRISDVVSSAALHRLDYYHLVLRPSGFEHQIRLWLDSPPGLSRYFSINRTSAHGDFTERERRLLEVLRPALGAIRDRCAPGTAPGTAAGVAGLSERETQVLSWVARGKRNEEIAALLVVSPHTVRTHLENSYRKLGVHTRTAAVRRAFGPAPPARPTAAHPPPRP
jgi:DNA-binding CsgD family transcriptional regulator